MDAAERDARSPTRPADVIGAFTDRAQGLDPQRPPSGRRELGSACLREVVDELAQAKGAWIVVDRLGDVLAHAPGYGPCPDPLATAIVSRSTRGLQSLWDASRPAGAPSLRAADTGDGIRVWSTASAPTPGELERVRSACAQLEPAVSDPSFADLLHGRGLHRVGSTPVVQLVAVRPGGRLAPLSRQADELVAIRGRVHTEGEWLYVALSIGEAAGAMVDALERRHGGQLHAGVADVREGALDWAAAAGLARRLALIAAAQGQSVASVRDPSVLVTLVLDEAHAAVASCLGELGVDALGRLRAYDQRTGMALLPSLVVWLSAGCEVAVAAKTLHTHPNTVRYRLRRAREISGFDLDDPHVQAALRLLLQPDRTGATTSRAPSAASSA